MGIVGLRSAPEAENRSDAQEVVIAFPLDPPPASIR